MGFVNCPKCGRIYSDKTEYCKKCKINLSPESLEQYKKEHPDLFSSIKCPACRKMIHKSSLSCMHCGKELSDQEIKQARHKSNKAIGLGCLVLVILAGVGTLSTNNKSEAPLAKSTVKPKTEKRAKEPDAYKGIVQNSAWDGSVWQVKSWMKDNMDDPKSIEYLEWSPVSKSGKGNWMVRTKFRAKNRLGAYVLANWVFYIDEKGNVIEYKDVSDLMSD